MLIWICDFNAHVKYPCTDLITASKWYHYFVDIKNHTDCTITD